MDSSQEFMTGEVDGEKDWTKVEFSERQRTPYSFKASEPHDDTKERPTEKLRADSTPGAFPQDESTTAPFTSGRFDSPRANPTPTSRSTDSRPAPDSSTPSGGHSERTLRPRTCRICLDVVFPTVEETIPSIPGLAPGKPRFIYQDPELGRLISPCKCKGSSRYVHEGCLQQWRMAAMQARNYWHCPTCGYAYRLQRLTYARFLQSVPAQLFLTLVLFVVAMFVMGFIADPLINLYLDPWSIIGWGWSDASIFEPIGPMLDEEDASGWHEHFFKGVAGLGVLGFLKFIVMSPLQIFRFRFGSSNSRQMSGRDRLEGLSWVVILVGIATTLYGIYTGVRAFSRRALMRTAERVLDVGGDNDDNE